MYFCNFFSSVVLLAAYSELNELHVTFLQGDIILLKPTPKDFSVFQTCLDNLQVVSDS